MTPGEYAGALKKFQPGAFLFYGEEQYLASRYLRMTREAYFDNPSIAAFNHIRLEGEQFTLERLLEAIQGLPVFSERKLIEVSGVSLNGMAEAEKKQLIRLLSLLPSYEYNTLLIIASPEELDPGTPKKPSALLRALSEVTTPVFFERQTPAKLNKWLGQHFAAWEVFAPATVCSFLIQYAGADMYTLSAQAEKCACYVLSHGRSELTEEDVRAAACSISEFDAFALSDAILAGNTDLALTVLYDRLRRRERPEFILSGIASVFQTMLRIAILRSGGMPAKEISTKTGIHAYRVERFLKSMSGKSEESIRHALELCNEADIKMKSSALDATCLLTRLVAECCL